MKIKTVKVKRVMLLKRGKDAKRGPLYERAPAVASARLEGGDLVVELERGATLRASLEALGVPRRPKPVRVWASELEGAVEMECADGSQTGVSTDHILNVLSSEYDPKGAEKARTELRERIAARLRLRRKQLGLTAEFVAQRAGLSRTNLGRMEKGAHLAQLDVLDRVADALRAPLADFVALEPPAWAAEVVPRAATRERVQPSR